MSKSVEKVVKSGGAERKRGVSGVIYDRSADHGAYSIFHFSNDRIRSHRRWLAGEPVFESTDKPRKERNK